MVLDLDNVEILIASDLHIREADVGLGHLFESCLRSMISQIKSHPNQQKLKAFILLGDVFDFCHGRRRYFQKKYQGIWKALDELAELIPEVVFIEGNHEFELNKLPRQSFKTIEDQFFKIQLSNSKTLLCCHGDLIAAPNAYVTFRNVIKSKVWCIASMLCPSPILDAYALKHAKVSRVMDNHDKMDHKAIRDCAIEQKQQHQADLMVFGHYHIPYAFSELEDSQPTVFSMANWAEPNFLAISGDAQVHRLIYKKSQKKFEKLSVERNLGK